mmetsp:Transcript_4039/g.14103  ORF Transcript_4039/g.14103 Transcript_4039/m.14103 type:complete len:255 (+) Transcript_4039:348-1112(+)
MIALYPAVNMLLCSRSSKMASWHSISCVTCTGAEGAQSTNPVMIASSSMPARRIRTFSPGATLEHSMSSLYTFVTLTCTLFGMTTSLSPRRTVPASVFPMTIVPMSLCLSNTGRRNGASGLRSSGSKSSSVSKKLFPSYHGHTSAVTLVFMFVPYSPEMGTYVTSLATLYPHDFRNGLIFVLISSQRSLLHFTVGSSILFTTTMSLETPRTFASCACSLVCPPRSNPVSNSPLRAAITSTPTSACAAPWIMFGT